jgi:hypothetical protein
MAAAAAAGPSRLMWISLALAALVLLLVKFRAALSPAALALLIPAAILLYFLGLPGKRERRRERRARTAKIVQDSLK